ncbi:Gfo/Idh/MocA family protein [Angustibacter aerolatus]|uniref:Oxidoreductase n=1 Tax=Angustibacter aerolatus TaxID=1162965 RepID=A0ABQ6JH09_9ACTN|nr:Gfo/Idh/MocA family oxidoreductase [Angustibacter aerolatus]GMA86836.1 oxidoreductase [Angustibacter aerolatus]
MTDLDSRPVRFGVVGTGGIAATFTDDLALLGPDTPAEVVAVGSRTQESADAFAAAHGVARAHGSYDALLADPDVDVVYVATPHPWHHPVALDAVRAGKHLLIEKPFTMTGDEAQEVVDAARDAGVFCMEAMWARWNPHVVAVREVLESGVLGDVVSVVADHAQWFEHDASHRVFAPELGGGALLDLGVYVVSFASMVLGTPTRVTARATPAFTGVDAQTSILLEHESGAHAVLSTTLLAKGSNRAAIVGTEGRLEIDEVWYAPTSFTVTPREGEAWTWDEPHEGHGLRHEAAEVVRCLRAGLLESPVLPLDETVAIMRTLDEVRAQSDL